MILNLLVEDRFQIVSAVDKDVCVTTAFLNAGEANTEASRRGLLVMLQHLAENGLSGIPVAWSHEVDENEKIYEFIKGRLRLFYFKGEGRQIAVCCGGVMKKGQKVDAGMVNASAKLRAEYFEAVKNNEIKFLDNEQEKKDEK